MTETVKMERMGYGPEAIGHLACGKTVFVRGAVAGDVAEVNVTEDGRTFARGDVVKLLEASPERVDMPKGLAFALAPWSALSYAAQLAAKEANVRSALLRTAHMDAEAVSSAMRPIVPCEAQLGYRNKVEMAAFRDEAGRFQLGFHERSSDETVVCSEMALGNRLIARAPKAFSGALRYLSGKDDLGIYRVGVRGSTATGSVEVALWTPPSGFPRAFAAKMLQDAIGATSVVRVVANPGGARKIKRVEVLSGDGFWSERMDVCSSAPGALHAMDFRISAPSFFQVNTAQAAKLVGLVLDALDVEAGLQVLDLYAGAGTFSIPLAKAGADVVAVELAGSSTKDFERNCHLNNIDVPIVCDDVARVLPDLVDGTRQDAIVVDPPRAGLDKAVVECIAQARPSKLAYVSCDPQTLARDVGRFAACGYALASAIPVDMFPQTYHIETVAILERMFC